MTAQLPDIAQPDLPFVWPDNSSSTMGIGVQPLDKGLSIFPIMNPTLNMATARGGLSTWTDQRDRDGCPNHGEGTCFKKCVSSKLNSTG